MQFGRASKTRLEFGLDEENALSDVNKAIDRIKYLRSRTETGDALRKAGEVIYANILNDFVSAHLYALFVCFLFRLFVCLFCVSCLRFLPLMLCSLAVILWLWEIGLRGKCRHGWFSVYGVCLFCLFVYILCKYTRKRIFLHMLTQWHGRQPANTVISTKITTCM